MAELTAGSDSARRKREALDSAFESKVYRRLLERMKHRFAERSFWLELCPELTVSDHPLARPVPSRALPPDLGATCAETIALDGYFVTPPLIPSDDVAMVALAAGRLAANGYPTGFACVYDQFWRLYDGLGCLVRPLLGEDYVMVPDGLWTFFVPPGDPGRSGWSAAGPHRDSIGPDPHLLATGKPGILNLWIALTDATPLNSCMYVLPAGQDEHYVSRREPPESEVHLQDVRALPVAAGSILGWTPHLLHWGGRSSSRASGPRISAALYLQRRDVTPFAEDVVAFDDRLPFEQRLSWIARSLAMPDLFSA